MSTVKDNTYKGDVTRDDSQTTIFSATQRCNAGTVLYPFERLSQQLMLQRYVALKVGVCIKCERASHASHAVH